MSTASEIIHRFHEREQGDVESLAFNAIMAQGGSITVADGGATFLFNDGSSMYTSSDVIGLCHSEAGTKPRPIKWSGDWSIFNWASHYKVYPTTHLKT